MISIIGAIKDNNKARCARQSFSRWFTSLNDAVLLYAENQSKSAGDGTSAAG